jgi:uncharacterized protein YjiS (DUF1127 family)
MPTQYTPSPAGTAGDAAAPGFDVSIPLVTDVISLVPDVMNGVGYDSDDVGARSLWTRSVVNLLKQVWHAFQEQRQRRRSRVALCGLSERALKDIGMTGAEIDCIVARGTIDRLRDGTAYPGMR